MLGSGEKGQTVRSSEKWCEGERRCAKGCEGVRRCAKASKEARTCPEGCVWARRCAPACEGVRMGAYTCSNTSTCRSDQLPHDSLPWPPTFMRPTTPFCLRKAWNCHKLRDC